MTVAAADTRARPGEVTTLFRTVVEGGYCIGCGACAAVEGSPIRMELYPDGRYLPVVDPHASDDELSAPVLAVCPFSGEGPDEDELADEAFPDAAPHPRIGRNLEAYAGYVEDPELRAAGSSGGMATWILLELLERELVDEVLHVRPTDDAEQLFAYEASGSAAQVRQRAKSRYYPVEMSEVLRRMRERPGRYALVGVPCFIKAARRLAATDPKLGERLRFTLALFCGHQKSTRFAELLGWQLGVEPGRLRRIDFRHKLPDRPANRYGVELVGDDARTRSAPVEDLLGGSWGEGLLKLRPCDFCDDVTGETADIAVGDAWLPGYVEDSAGTNVVVARHPALRGLIEEGIAAGALHLDRIEADDVARSQAGGLRHRREGLAYRLALTDAAGRWRPRKRVAPDAAALGHRGRRIMRLRERLAHESHGAFAAARASGQLERFEARLERPLREYRTLYAPLRWRLVMRIPGPLRRAAKALLRLGGRR